jgi:hypothetical protein
MIECGTPRGERHQIGADRARAKPIPTDLTRACRPNHNLAEQGWTTRKISRATPNSPHRPASAAGDPAPGTHHHPEKLLQDNEDDEDNAP